MKLVPLNNVYPSAYNPRLADPRRLDLIEISLRKLGFLLPLYCDANGEILSGHQRHLVAERMGLTDVPVEYTKPMELDMRQAVNVVFNRATNDLAAEDTPKSLTEALARSDVFALAEKLPDREGDLLYPCLFAESVPVALLTAANEGRWVNYAAAITRTLAPKGVVMPIIATRDLRVVNGIGRLQYLAENKVECAQVVFVTLEEAALSDAMLNLLSMDFDIHTRYADILRHNSFRRANGRHDHRLGTGSLWPLKVGAEQFDVDNADNWRLWKQRYGTRVLDFGAGHGEDVMIYRANGIDADVFEPYKLHDGSNDIDEDTSRALTRTFLEAVASGKQWATLFVSAVFNSIPFDQDRRYVCALLAALATPHTTLYTYTASVKHSSLKNAKGRGGLGNNAARHIQFALDYEPNTLIGEFNRLPKVQKYFTPAELKDMLMDYWSEVTTGYETILSSATAICSGPRKIDRAHLRAAIEFEFDLPYPDGTRMGLVDEALDAFSQRLGITL